MWLHFLCVEKVNFQINPFLSKDLLFIQKLILLGDGGGVKFEAFFVVYPLFCIFKIIFLFFNYLIHRIFIFTLSNLCFNLQTMWQQASSIPQHPPQYSVFSCVNIGMASIYPTDFPFVLLTRPLFGIVPSSSITIGMTITICFAVSWCCLVQFVLSTFGEIPLNFWKNNLTYFILLFVFFLNYVLLSSTYLIERFEVQRYTTELPPRNSLFFWQ